MPSYEIVFWKRSLHKYVYTYAYIHIWRALFQNTIYNLGMCITNPFSFWNGAYRVLEKELFIYWLNLCNYISVRYIRIFVSMLQYWSLILSCIHSNTNNDCCLCVLSRLAMLHTLSLSHKGYIYRISLDDFVLKWNV